MTYVSPSNGPYNGSCGRMEAVPGDIYAEWLAALAKELGAVFKTH